MESFSSVYLCSNCVPTQTLHKELHFCFNHMCTNWYLISGLFTQAYKWSSILGNIVMLHSTRQELNKKYLFLSILAILNTRITLKSIRSRYNFYCLILSHFIITGISILRVFTDVYLCYRHMGAVMESRVYIPVTDTWVQRMNQVCQ